MNDSISVYLFYLFVSSSTVVSSLSFYTSRQYMGFIRWSNNFHVILLSNCHYPLLSLSVLLQRNIFLFTVWLRMFFFSHLYRVEFVFHVVLLFFRCQHHMSRFYSSFGIVSYFWIIKLSKRISGCEMGRSWTRRKYSLMSKSKQMFRLIAMER